MPARRVTVPGEVLFDFAAGFVLRRCELRGSKVGRPLCVRFDEAPPEPLGQRRRFIGIGATFHQKHVVVVEDLDFAVRGPRARDEDAAQRPGRPERMSRMFREPVRAQPSAILDGFRLCVSNFQFSG
jgi:hypothetical protein